MGLEREFDTLSLNSMLLTNDNLYATWVREGQCDARDW